MSWLVLAYKKGEFKSLAETYGFDTREPAERKARELSARDDTGIVGLCKVESEEPFLDGRNSEENYEKIMSSYQG